MKYKMSASLPTGPYPVPASYSAPGVTQISTDYGGKYGVLASYVGTMKADASADVFALHQETVTIAGVQFFYDVSLTVSETFQLLNAFGVTGWGDTKDASFNVSVVNVSDLALVLESAINKAASATDKNDASVAAPGATGTMNEDLNNEVYKQLMLTIQNDGLINSVENQYADTWYRVDASSGAWNTAHHYNGAGAQADRDLLFLQIPSDTLNRYMDASEEPLSNALLLAPGDKITFVWDVETNINAKVVNVRDSDTNARTPAAGQGSNTTAATGYTAPGTLVNLKPAKVRVAVTMTLTDASTVKELVTVTQAKGPQARFLVGPTALRASKA